MAVIEDQPILQSQVMTRLQLMRAIASPGDTAPSTDRAYRELFEARLIAWDAARLRLEVQDTDVERMLDAMATKQGMQGGRAEFLATVRKSGIEVSTYQVYLRQALLAARWEASSRPPAGSATAQRAPTKAQRLAALEAEALIDRPEGLYDLRPSPQRTCLPKTQPRALLPSPSKEQNKEQNKEQRVAAVCIEGSPGPETEVMLADLARTLPPQATLSRDAVARSLIELLASPAHAEAAAVYGLPLRPGGDPSGPLFVVYRLRPRPLLSGIEPQGNPDGVALPAVTIAPNTRYSHRELRSHLDEALSALHDAGYFDAAARAERLPRGNESEPQRVRLKLVPGLRTYIAQIILPGVGQVRLAEVQALIGLRAGDPLSEMTLLASRPKLSEYYTERGFIKAFVETFTTEPAPPRADGSPQVAVRMVVTEGKPYRLGTLKLAGALPLSEAELRKMVAAQRGDLLRPTALRKDVERLIEAGKRAGKPVTIEAVSAINDTLNTVDMTLTFVPAPAVPAVP